MSIRLFSQSFLSIGGKIHAELALSELEQYITNILLLSLNKIKIDSGFLPLSQRKTDQGLCDAEGI